MKNRDCMLLGYNWNKHTHKEVACAFGDAWVNMPERLFLLSLNVQNNLKLLSDWIAIARWSSNPSHRSYRLLNFLLLIRKIAYSPKCRKNWAIWKVVILPRKIMGIANMRVMIYSQVPLQTVKPFEILEAFLQNMAFLVSHSLSLEKSRHFNSI